MAYPEITQLTPLPPRGSDPAVFTAGYNQWFAEQPRFIDDVNAAGQYFEQQATAADDAASDAQSSAQAAELAQDLAEDARDSSQQYRNESEQFKDQAEAAVAVLPDGTIDDLLTDPDKAWSSQKTSDELALKRDLTNNSFPRYDLNNEVSTTTLDLSESNVFEVDARTVSRTLSFSNLPASGRDTTVKLYVRGNNSVTFSDVINWSDAEKPDLGDSWTVLVFSIAGNNIYGNIWGSA